MNRRYIKTFESFLAEGAIVSKDTTIYKRTKQDPPLDRFDTNPSTEEEEQETPDELEEETVEDDDQNEEGELA